MKSFDSPSAFAEQPVILIRLELPPTSKCKFTLTFREGGPLRITGGSPEDEKYIGYYVSGLELPDINAEISNFAKVEHLTHFFHACPNATHTLILSRHPPPTFPLPAGCVYTYKNLPLGDLGIEMTGFPAKIASVAASSPLSGRVHPDQMIHAVMVPGKPTMDRNSPGFTGKRVQEWLQSHEKCPGRVLIVMDKMYDDNTKPGSGRYEVAAPGERSPFDFGGFIPRMFQQR